MSERFVKAVQFKDVRAKDWVCDAEETGAMEVLSCETVDQGSAIRLHLVGGDVLQDIPGKFIGLLYRPRPEWKTEKDLRDDLRLYASLILTTEEIEDSGESYHLALMLLRMAMDAHELGKPLNNSEK